MHRNDEISQVRHVFKFVSTPSFQQLAQTARTQAVVGAAAGVTLGAIRGFVLVRRKGARDAFQVATEGITQVGTGAVLGVLGGLAASVTGVSVTAAAGRGILAIAAPVVASAMITSNAHDPVARVIRTWSERLLDGLRGSLQSSQPMLQLPRA